MNIYDVFKLSDELNTHEDFNLYNPFTDVCFWKDAVDYMHSVWDQGELTGVHMKEFGYIPVSLAIRNDGDVEAKDVKIIPTLSGEVWFTNALLGARLDPKDPASWSGEGTIFYPFEYTLEEDDVHIVTIPSIPAYSTVTVNLEVPIHYANVVTLCITGLSPWVYISLWDATLTLNIQGINTGLIETVCEDIYASDLESFKKGVISSVTSWILTISMPIPSEGILNELIRNGWKIFCDILGKVIGKLDVESGEKFIEPILGPVRKAIFDLRWYGSILELKVTSPNGEIFYGVLKEGICESLVVIDYPEYGEWKYEIYGKEVPDEGEKYFLIITTVIEGESNIAPIANANGPYEIDEGSILILNASISFDINDETLFYRWDLNNDGSWDTEWSINQLFSYACFDDWYNYVVVEVNDGEMSDYSSANIIINNVDPTVEEITAPLDPIPVDANIIVLSEFIDLGVLDTHSAIWDWGDGSSGPGEVVEEDGIGFVTGTHSYLHPGVYTIELTVIDDDGGIGASDFQYIVVYDSDDGFVTGGGWIESPVGAYSPDLSLAGKATFGFVSKYKKGASEPTGNTEFVFHVADLNFHSCDYDWLVIAGNNAKYKGTGTINGEGEFGFMLTARDGDLKDAPDSFRIKIWDKSTDETIYDNKMGESDDSYDGTLLSGGNIVIHNQKEK